MSFYGPPCAPAFVGDNGGATYKGVSATEVRIAVGLGSTNQTSYEGEVPSRPSSGENAQDRTFRVLTQYFNEAFQLYGRRMRVFSMQPGTGEASQRTKATKADQEYKVFAAVATGFGSNDEYARRKLPMFSGNQLSARRLDSRAPYNWSWYMDIDQVSRIGAEYICKKLSGKKARFAGDPLYQDAERVFGGVFYEDSVVWEGTSRVFDDELHRHCGIRMKEKIAVNLTESDGQASYGTVIARLKAAGVTTVVYGIDYLSGAALTSAADSQGFNPEWFLPAAGAADQNNLARLQSQTQWSRAFGFTAFEMERPADEWDCYRAYTSIDPGNSPHQGVCQYVFPPWQQVVTAIQMAGPKLTPESFTAGLRSMGRRFVDDPVWAIGGGYGPGDFTYTDNVTEIWWDPTADDPRGGSGIGSYRYVRDGKRYREGELPVEDPKVFDRAG